MTFYLSVTKNFRFFVNFLLFLFFHFFLSPSFPKFVVSRFIYLAFLPHNIIKPYFLCSFCFLISVLFFITPFNPPFPSLIILFPLAWFFFLFSLFFLFYIPLHIFFFSPYPSFFFIFLPIFLFLSSPPFFLFFHIPSLFLSFFLLFCSFSILNIIYFIFRLPNYISYI